MRSVSIAATGAILISVLSGLAQADPAKHRAVHLGSVQSVRAASSQALSDHAETEYGLGHIREAEALLRQALSRSRTLGETAGLKNNLAELYREEGKYDEAEKLQRWVLRYYQRTYGPLDEFTGVALHNIGGTLEAKGLYREAEAYYLNGLNVAQKQTNAEPSSIAKSYNNIGGLYFREGRYSEAARNYQAGISDIEAREGPDGQTVAKLLANFAAQKLTTGQSAEAEALLKRALAIWDKTGRPPAPYATAAQTYANILVQKGELEKAEQLARSALEFVESIDQQAGRKRLQTAHAMNVLADILERRGRKTDALAMKREATAIAIQATTAGHPEVAILERSLATTLVAQGNIDEARDLLRRSLANHRQGEREGQVSSKETEEALGRLEFEQGHLSIALPLLRSGCGVTLADGRVSEQSGPAQSGYEHGCSAYLASALTTWARNGGGQGPQDSPAALRAEAFVWAQRATKSTASEALSASSARALAERTGMANEAAAYEENGRRIEALSAQFTKAVSEGHPQLPQLLNKSISEAYAERSALEAQLQARVPRYWDYRSPSPLTLHELQTDLLRPNEALILWMVPQGTEHGLAFAISRTDVAVEQITVSGDEVARDVRTLREGLDTPRVAEGTFNRQVAYRLYSALLGAHDIQRVISAPRIDILLVAPSGALTSLPPSVLVTQTPEGENTDLRALSDTHWLIKDKALAILPAVSSLHTLRRLLPAVRHVGTRPLLALADPDFRGSGTVPTGPVGTQTLRTSTLPDAAHFQRDGGANENVRDLRPLYGTLAEGRAIAAMLAPGDASALLLGPLASKSNLFKRQADGSLAQTEVLSFSTHGLLTGDFAGLDEPALALAYPSQPDVQPFDDGLLRASQAATLTLNANWVILSACNTASGSGNGAEGLSGLARAFFYAGATTLLASHWRVDDEATVKLIVETLHRKSGGETKAQALRNSMIELLSDPRNAHPAYWAPFVVIGEPQ